MAQFYNTEIERLDDADVAIIDKLIQQVQDDKAKHMNSELAQNLLSNAEVFLGAVKAVAEK